MAQTWFRNCLPPADYWPAPRPRRRVEARQNGVVARPERPLRATGVEPERLSGGAPDAGNADDDQVVAEEGEVLGPAVAPRIKEAVRLPGYPPPDLLALGPIAEGAAPGEVLEVVRPLSSTCRRHAALGPTSRGSSRGSSRGRPERGRDDVVDVKLPYRWQQAVLAGIAGTEPHGETHELVSGTMQRPARQEGEQGL